MKKRLIYDDPSGVACIIVPNECFQQPKETEAEAVARLFYLVLPEVTEFLVCCEDKIPKDLTFRQAWKKGDVHEPIKIDFEKAILIHRERIREAARAKVDHLNLELKSAFEDRHIPRQVSISATIKILGKIHEMNLSHCKTIEDIKNSVPKELRDVWTYYDFKDY
jgi:hypothetical protein